MTSRLAFGIRALLVSVVVVACMPGEKPPDAPVRGTIAPADAAGRSTGTAGFAVVYAGPRGQAPASAEIAIVWNRALRKLGSAGAAELPPLSIVPAARGLWQWVGTRALTFVPESGRLPGATHFVVTVPAGIPSVDGEVLALPVKLDFETPRPEIVATNPGSGSERLDLDTVFEVELSQPVDPARFEQGVTLVAEMGSTHRSLPFVASRPDPRLPKKILVRPRAPLPKNSAIRMEVTDRLVGEEGPLPAHSATLSYRTYGPLTLASVDCDTSTAHGGCAPGSPIGITLSNPVRLSDLRKAITVTPGVPALRVGGGDPSELTEYLSLGGAFAAGSTYSIRIEGLVDRYGQRLTAPIVRTIRIDDHAPRVEIGVTGDALVPGAATAIPIGSVNVAGYDLVTASLAPGDLSALLSPGRPGETATQVAASRLALLGKVAGASTRKVIAGVPKNQLAKESVAIASSLGKGRGVLGIGVRYDRAPSDPGDSLRILKVSDLAISAKLSRYGSFVWVTRLSTGAPVAAAEVELLSPTGRSKRYVTKEDGVAELPAADFDPRLSEARREATPLVIVRSGEDWTFERVTDHLPEWRIPVATDFTGKEAEYGMMFTERGLYRPGEVVRVKGILRQMTRTGNATPAGQELTVALRSPEDEVVAKLPVTTSRYGTFAAEVRVPPSASLGSWSLVASPKGKGFEWDELVASEGFEVAEYRPSEFDVKVERQAPAYLRGEQARFVVHGDYLFGAPMAGAGVRYSVTRAPASYDVPGLDGFVTDASAFWSDKAEAPLGSSELGAEEVKLDAHGALTVSRKLELPGQRGPESVRLEAEVTDVSRQTAAASASSLVHPAEFYVGLFSADDRFLSAGGDFEARVVAATPSGARLSGKRVHVDLVQRRWTLAREPLPGGGTHSVTRLVDTKVGGCDVVTAAAPATCRMRVESAGYHLAVARATDSKGNTIESAVALYATGAGGGALFGDRDAGTVELVPNKKQYRVGDTAKVLVKMPFSESEAWVTVERAGVYRSERVKLKGGTPTVSVPITADLRPNAFVSVHLLRPASGKTRGPLYRVGYAELSVDPESRRLSVEVTPSRKELKPGAEVSIDMVVKDKTSGAAARSELAVYAVDEGVLMLTGYRTPDPVPVFTASWPLQVATLESRDSMATISLPELGSVGMNKGAEGGGGGMGARSDFRQTAFYDARVETDDRGRATVRFRLPESLTTYRVMAVATTAGDQYGFGSASVTTTQKLLTRPNLPRFVRAGDRASAGVILTSRGLPASRATVRVSASGLLVAGPTESVVDLPKDGSVEVRFPLRAETAGTAKLRFDVTAGGERDAVEVTRSVQAPGTKETVALYGSTDRVSAEGIGDLSAVRRDVGSLALSLAPSALVGLDGAMAQLTSYPYECTEQLSSRLLPLLPLRDLARAYGFALPRDTDAVAGRAVGEILARQRGDGGFGMWPDSAVSEPWVSAYAAWTLDQAAASGVVVSRTSRDRAHDFLRRALAAGDGSLASLATRAFITDVLSASGAPDVGYMTRLFEQRDKLPLFAQAFLLHALSTGKGPKAAISELQKRLEAGLRLAKNTAFAVENEGDEYAALFDSSARSTALALRALLAVDPKHPLGEPLARGLLGLRRGSAWENTQASAYALLALDAYRRARESKQADMTAKVWLGGALLESAKLGRDLRAERTVIDLSRLPREASKLVFEKQGQGTLFYEARLEYVRKTLPADAEDQGFFVQRSARSVTPGELSGPLPPLAGEGARKFRAGDIVQTDLVVVAPTPRSWVVIEDPLPAGFEAVNTRLRTTASWIDVESSAVTGACGGDPECEDAAAARDALAHGRATLPSQYHQEVRDDRVLFFVDHLPAGMYRYRYLARATTAGSFVVPPAKAEEMYSPEVFGRTFATTVEVE